MTTNTSLGSLRPSLPEFADDYYWDSSRYAPISMMPSNINKTAPRRTLGHPVYRYLRHIIDPLLSHNYRPMGPDGGYLSNSCNEEGLRTILHEEVVSGGSLLVGDKGIGKSTLLQNLWQDAMKPSIKKNCLRIGLDVENQPNRQYPHDILLPVIAAAGEKLVMHYGINDLHDSFLDYMHVNTPILWEAYKMKKESFKDEVTIADQNDTGDNTVYRCAIERLKWICQKVINREKHLRIELVMDNIECMNNVWVSRLLIDLTVFLKCMNQLNKDQSTGHPLLTRHPLVFRVLVSCRKFTYNTIVQAKAWTQYRKWWHSSTHTMQPCGTLEKIMRLRFQAARKEQKDLAIADDFDTCEKRLFEVIDEVDRRYENLFMNLANNDIRLALAILRDVLRNETHMNTQISEAEMEPGAFSPTSGKYQFKEANIIRAIFLDEAGCFSNVYGRFLNILSTSPQPSGDLAYVYLLHFLIQYEKNGAHMDKKLLRKTLRGIPPFSHLPQDKAYDYIIAEMIKRRLLYEEVISRDGQKKSHSVCVSPRGRMLFEFNLETSVVLEIWRDDLHLKSDHGSYFVSEKPSLMLQADERFEAVLRVAEWILDTEAAHALHLAKKKGGISAKHLFRDYFNGRIGKMFIGGILRSIHAYYIQETDKKRQLIELADKIFHKHDGVWKQLQEAAR